ncbi:SJCHGC05670 protein [Beggiatoa sp. PS]|nr:SJCHGC05670 protein [Beggiatoa sp. PS]
MESQGIPDCIQVSQTTYSRIKDKFHFEQRGPIDVKGKGKMETYLLKGRK